MNPTRKMHRYQSGTGFFHQKQQTKISKGKPNGRSMKVVNPSN